MSWGGLYNGIPEGYFMDRWPGYVPNGDPMWGPAVVRRALEGAFEFTNISWPWLTKSLKTVLWSTKSPLKDMEVSQNWGTLIAGCCFKGKIRLKWMITRGTPILGNHHIVTMVSLYVAVALLRRILMQMLPSATSRGATLSTCPLPEHRRVLQVRGLDEIVNSNGSKAMS